MKQLMLRPLFIVLGCFLTLSVWAQDPSGNSPYSRYGIGNIFGTDFQAVKTMGGISTGYKSSYTVNLSNPASLGFLNTTSFDVGIFAKLTSLEAGSQTANAADGNLTHLSLGFPLKNSLSKALERKDNSFSWGTAFGLMPYSVVGYQIESTETRADVGDVIFENNGSGGYYQVYLANAARYKSLSLGLNVGYIFGKTVNERVVGFPDIENPFADILKSEINLNGFVYKLGAQYEFILDGKETETEKEKKRKTRLVLGVAGNSANNLTTTSKELAERVNPFYGRDTFSNTEGIERMATLPSEWSFGATLSKDLSWLIGIDYRVGNWSQYVNEAKPEVLADTRRFAIGGEYIPNWTSYNKYFNRVSYRLGYYYETDPRVIGTEQLRKTALTFGVGMPIQPPKKGTVGYMNFGFEAGKFGTADLIEENFFQFNIGFTLNDNSWFYKRKFD